MLIQLIYLSNYSIPVRRKIDQLDHLPKLGKILTRILDFLQSIANCVCLVNDLEDSIANGALVEQVIHGRHLGKPLKLPRASNCKLYKSRGISKPDSRILGRN